MDLHTAQKIDETAEAYGDLILNGMEQIKNLEEQNREYRKQQEGLDVLSEKYQELEANILSNEQAIMSMKVSQEQWNDSIFDLQIDKLSKFKDELSKTNDQYQRQKDLQTALEEVERARSQRTQRVFVEGQGFVYQSDQDALKSAQENLEDTVHNELINSIDDLIDALDSLHADSNVYDASGNLIGTEYTIPQIGDLSQMLTDYYNKDTMPALGELIKSVTSFATNTTNNGNTTISFGDINLSEVDNASQLAQVIINQLPNALLQALYKK